jgi:hypothetical protein
VSREPDLGSLAGVDLDAVTTGGPRSLTCSQRPRFTGELEEAEVESFVRLKLIRQVMLGRSES